jgi:GTP cyclohydrolase I
VPEDGATWRAEAQRATFPDLTETEPQAALRAVQEAHPGRKPVDQGKVREATLMLLDAIGENPLREGLRDTPDRVARAWAEFMDYDPGKVSASFASEGTDQMVVVSGMRVWSLCEHHLLPFYCDVTVGYLADDHLLGLSKLARIAHKHAHGLQVQERLVEQIAAEVKDLAGTRDVAVVASGVHLCMVMRGVRTDGRMTSASISGRFREPSARAEFMSLAANASQL